MSRLENKFLASNAVDARALATDAVETLKIKNLNVTKAKLAASSVDMSKIDPSILNVANGLVKLDGSAKIPASLLNVGAMQYKGAWDATGAIPSGSAAIATLGVDFLNLTADANGEALNGKTVVFSETSGTLGIVLDGNVFTITYDIGTTDWNALNTYINTNHSTLGFSSEVGHDGAFTISNTTGGLFAGGSSPKSGDLYQVSVAGTVDLGGGHGEQSFAVGDAIIFDGSFFEKCPGNDLIVSVNEKTGAVVLGTHDIQEDPIVVGVSEISKITFSDDLSGLLDASTVEFNIATASQPFLLQYYTGTAPAAVSGKTCIPVLVSVFSSANATMGATASALGTTYDALFTHSEAAGVMTIAATHSGAVTDPSTSLPGVLDVSVFKQGVTEVPSDNLYFTLERAIAAMGVKGNGNPLNHDRYTDLEAVGAMGVKGNSNPLNHDRYTDLEAVGAMGVKGDGNPLNHDRYTDLEARAASKPKAVLHTLTAGEVTAKAFDLPSAPDATCLAAIVLYPLGGLPQAYSVDFTVSDATVSWSTLGMDDLALIAGDKIQVMFY